MNRVITAIVLLAAIVADTHAQPGMMQPATYTQLRGSDAAAIPASPTGMLLISPTFSWEPATAGGDAKTNGTGQRLLAIARQQNLPSPFVRDSFTFQYSGSRGSEFDYNSCGYNAFISSPPFQAGNVLCDTMKTFYGA